MQKVGKAMYKILYKDYSRYSTGVETKMKGSCKIIKICRS